MYLKSIMLFTTQKTEGNCTVSSFMICTPYLNYPSDKLEEFAIGRREARTGDGSTAHCALVRNINGRNNTVMENDISRQCTYNVTLRHDR